MTRADKLLVHLESIIFADLPPGTRLNARQVECYCADATEDQRRRAFERALVRVPLLVDEEREGGWCASA